jgi:hypothetical protein
MHVKLKSTWQYMRTSVDQIAKKLDIFLLLEPRLEDSIRIQQRENSDEDSDLSSCS